MGTKKSFEVKKMQHEDLAWSNDQPSLTYSNPIQKWIEQECGLTCQSWHDISVSIHSHELKAMFCNVVIFVPVHNHLIFDIALFFCS
jgi:hypothetical protein